MLNENGSIRSEIQRPEYIHPLRTSRIRLISHIDATFFIPVTLFLDLAVPMTFVRPVAVGPVARSVPPSEKRQDRISALQ